MADPELVKLLRQGSIVGNAWRKGQSSTQRLDLSYADLSYTDLSNTYLAGVSLIFPIKLDNTVMETNLPWAANMRRMRHIGDFTRWKEHDEYQKGLSRLLRDLKQDIAAP